METALRDILRCQKEALLKLEALQRQLQKQEITEATGGENGVEGEKPLAMASEGIALPPLKIASFNIQVFGERKMGKEEVTEVLIKILQRYDLILILEIRDSSETALDQLVEECNKVSPQAPFSSVVSARLGRTVSKEQYGFMFRQSKLQVKDTYQFDDGVDDGTDMFQREPFVVRFTSPTTELEDFAILATHTDPDEAAKEVGALHKVYDAARMHWGLEDILIAGDFNADESYVSRDDWATITLKHDKRFTWLIQDSTDTTTGHTDRAYDRFVVAGEKLTRAVVPGRTKVFHFDKAFGLTHEEAEAVSDHYPIEMELCGKINRELQKQLRTSLCVTVTQKTPVEKENDVRKIYRADVGSESAHFQSHVNYDDSRMAEVVATRLNVDDVITALREFQAVFPNVVHDGTVQMVRAYIEGSSIFTPPSNPDHPYIYGLARDATWEENADDGGGCKRGALDVTVTASLQEPLTCAVTVSMRMS
ncbi:deoxyribonuclease-1-like [Plakobranchus ocellatus]|uniref:Deoxyribonuclease-1-like n=1 Tax=Plakobranchus ocellatus TaxID=259542 RepID=A0AAV4D633_9GAST|nr:deoxyribonuclease-1-like [Plakobranchus ocellatus]